MVCQKSAVTTQDFPGMGFTSTGRFAVLYRKLGMSKMVILYKLLEHGLRVLYSIWKRGKNFIANGKSITLIEERLYCHVYLPLACEIEWM